MGSRIGGVQTSKLHGIVILEKLIGLQLVEIFMHFIQPNCFYCVHKSLEKYRFAEHDTLKLAGIQQDLCVTVIEASQQNVKF